MLSQESSTSNIIYSIKLNKNYKLCLKNSNIQYNYEIAYAILAHLEIDLQSTTGVTPTFLQDSTKMTSINYQVLKDSALCNLQERQISIIPNNIYLFRVTNRNDRKRCEICSKLTMKIPEQSY